jgi:hypothetical protein
MAPPSALILGLAIVISTAIVAIAFRYSSVKVRIFTDDGKPSYERIYGRGTSSQKEKASKDCSVSLRSFPVCLHATAEPLYYKANRGKYAVIRLLVRSIAGPETKRSDLVG